MGNEFQNAFELSRIERATREPDEATLLIQSLLEAGRFVVCADVVVHCRFTDATLGVDYWPEADFSTFEEAEAWYVANLNQFEFQDGLTIKTPVGYEPPLCPQEEEEKDEGYPF